MMMNIRLLLLVGALVSLPVTQSSAADLAADKHVVFLYGTEEYGPENTFPELAREFAVATGARVSLVESDPETRELPDLDFLEEADLLVLFLRFRLASEEQMQRFSQWFDDGRPAVAFRTTSHAFWEDKGWFPRYFGGHYKAHANNREGTVSSIAPAAWSHPILNGVPASFRVAEGGTYNAQPLSDFATPLLFGKTGDLPAEPVAWTAEYQAGQRLFYTSLGGEENFESDAFRNLCHNAMLWALDKPVPQNGVLNRDSGRGDWTEVTDYTAPIRQLPSDGTVLFAGDSAEGWSHWDPSVAPRAIGIDRRADSTVGGPVFEQARWTVDKGALVARPGYGDIVSDAAFGDSLYQLDFMIPKSPDGVSEAFRGASGVYIDGRWEIGIVDSSSGHTLSATETCGAIFGVHAPLANACKAPGEWQRLEVAVRHLEPNVAELTVWLNGTQIHDRARVEDRTLYGFDLGALGEEEPWEEEDEDFEEFDGPELPRRAVVTKEATPALDMGEDFTVTVRFATERGGSLFAMALAEGEWPHDGKMLFVREGGLVFDIGFLGEVATDDLEIDDGDPHEAVVVHRDGLIQIYVDGTLEATSESDFQRPDGDDFVFKVGIGSENFPESGPKDFFGVIDELQYFDRAWTRRQIRSWRASNQPSTPLRYRYANDALEEEILETIVAFEEEGEEFEDEEFEEDELEEEGFDEEEEEWAEVDDTDSIDPFSGPLRLQADASEVRFANIIRRPLSEIDHASVIQGLDDEALASGKAIYESICVTCHGNLEREGSLPTSRKFWEAEFKAGNDPYALFNTLTSGYGQMPAFAFLTSQQRYDVIHYIREAFLKPENPGQYFEADAAYLAGLPRGIGGEETLTAEQEAFAKGPVYERMNFGPALNWTYQVEPGNIAYKGIAVRLDEGPGGVSKGRAWLVYDHDTMRVAAGWTGRGFVDWRGIAFDGSHGTHTSIVGDRVFVNPVGPGWAHPQTGSWEDDRFIGRDDKPYGPLAKDWVTYHGHRLYGSRLVIEYSVGSTSLRETPGLERIGGVEALTRTLNLGPSREKLRLRVAPEATDVALLGPVPSGVALEVVDGFWVVAISPSASERAFRVAMAAGPIDANLATTAAPAEDLGAYLNGGPKRWDSVVETQWTMSEDQDSAFVSDTLTTPNADANPWNAWMRLGGLDFHPDNPDRMAVCTWMGDVWLVDGVRGNSGTLRWHRIATGLFQPLGVKYRDGALFVTCRDQLVELRDLNGDEEIDQYVCFNNDHQVTEHFHEFAMGLQTDDDGNFYYAKSARHAKTALVAHHGTLLRISADGSRTDILATGFRAANGVAINPDGSFFVTDQEGHWTPKNRINRVVPGGFYGNMMGYHDVSDTSDEAMEQPMVWVTNAMDRSPGELLWVDGPAQWGPLNGALLNLSYGTGRVFVVLPQEVDGQYQGGVVRLPIPDFPTGVMRGRFHPENGQLYSCGMFAWAGNRQDDGGLYRVRYTGKELCFPTGMNAVDGGVRLTFSAPLDPDAASQESAFRAKAWGLQRSRNYGSRHVDEGPLTVRSATLGADGREVFLEIPDLKPTWGMEIQMDLRSRSGRSARHVIHNTIHKLAPR